MLMVGMYVNFNGVEVFKVGCVTKYSKYQYLVTFTHPCPLTGKIITYHGNWPKKNCRVQY